MAHRHLDDDEDFDPPEPPEDPDDPESPEDPEGPGEHDAHLLDDEDGSLPENDLVPCPACGKMVLATADRCHRCGEYFGQEAWLAQPSSSRAVWAVAVALVIAAMLWFVLGTLI